MKERVPRPKRGGRATQSLAAALAFHGLIATTPAESKGHPPHTDAQVVAETTFSDRVSPAEEKRVQEDIQRYRTELLTTIDEWHTVHGKLVSQFHEASQEVRHLITALRAKDPTTSLEQAVKTLEKELLDSFAIEHPEHAGKAYDTALDIENILGALSDILTSYPEDVDIFSILYANPPLVDPHFSPDATLSRTLRQIFENMQRHVGTYTQDENTLMHAVPGTTHPDVLKRALLIVALHDLAAFDAHSKSLPPRNDEPTTPL